MPMPSIPSIQKKFLYQHHNSVEASTGVVKDKYKLLVNVLSNLDMYIFIIGTTQTHNKGKTDTLEVSEQDWENINGMFQSIIKNVAYYSWRSTCVHNISDTTFFRYVSKLKDTSYQKLMDLNRTINIPMYPQLPHNKKLARLALCGEDVADGVVKRLGLN